MSRALSTVAKQAIFGQESEQVFLLLLTISHASLVSPIRVVNDNANIVSGGNTYVAFPFELSLPDDKEESIPAMRLKIDNVDQTIIQSVRTLTTPPSITLTVVLASSPNTVEASFSGFVLRNVEYDALVIEGELRLEDVLGEGFPSASFDPARFPGLYG